MMPDAERKACALRELDAVVYFGLNRREAFFYRLLRPRREMFFGRAILKDLAQYPEGPITDWTRSRLMGTLDGLYSAKGISAHMHMMLQHHIQDRKD
jgi:hypothetical protein